MVWLHIFKKKTQKIRQAILGLPTQYGRYELQKKNNPSHGPPFPRRQRATQVALPKEIIFQTLHSEWLSVF